MNDQIADLVYRSIEIRLARIVAENRFKRELAKLNSEFEEMAKLPKGGYGSTPTKPTSTKKGKSGGKGKGGKK